MSTLFFSGKVLNGEIIEFLNSHKTNENFNISKNHAWYTSFPNLNTTQQHLSSSLGTLLPQK
jgi:hypothetical protein